METIDPVLTSWAKEWWPNAEVYLKESSNSHESASWFIRNGPVRGALQLKEGGRQAARVALHFLVSTEIHREAVRADAR